MITQFRGANGLTLIELLVALVCLGILATHAAPFFGSLVANANRHSAASNLISLLNVARQTAVSEGQTVTVCAIDAKDKCTPSWDNPIVAFRDPGRLRRIDKELQVIRLIQPEGHGTFHANLGIRDYLRFRSSGMSREAIGNVVWCPEGGDPRLAFQIRINMGGRIHRSEDTDGDGIVEGSTGQPVSCPG